MHVMVVSSNVLVFFNPTAQGKAEKLRLDADRFAHWVAQGAQPSERVASLAAQAKKLQLLHNFC